MITLKEMARQLYITCRRQESDGTDNLMVVHIKRFREQDGSVYTCTHEEFAAMIDLCQRIAECFPGSIHLVSDISYDDPLLRTIGTHKFFTLYPQGGETIFEKMIG
jgi:hypothetical protein